MRIAYDHQIFSLQEYGGISRYFVETASRLAAIPDTGVSVLAYAHVNGHLEQAARGIMMMKYPQIIKDATEAKLEKLRD